MGNAGEPDRTAVTRWEGEGGGGTPSAGRINDQARSDAAAEDAMARASLDTAHDSSARGEHRYPDAQQTAAERGARDARDDFKRRLRRR
jgi:hypothetical protein